MSAPAESDTRRRFSARVALLRPASAQTVPPAILAGTAVTARLFASGKDPVTAAADDVHAAWLACADALEAGIDGDLAEAFGYARSQLDLAARMTADTRLSGLAEFLASQPGGVGAQPAVAEAPRLNEAVSTSREEIYGLRATMRHALSFLTDAVQRLGALPRRQASTQIALPVLGLVSVAAARIARLADVVVAHYAVDTRTRTPELPGMGGDVELYSGARATPFRHAALTARVRFTPGRVEITTAQGRVSIGQESAIGMLLWVAPGETSALEEAMDPREAAAPVPEVDELGTVHVLDLSGRSLASLAVSDWASQPSTVVDQALVDPGVGSVPLGAARGVAALRAIGFTRGAATIGVPLRHGVAHPPPATGSVGVRRPAPARIAYLGRAADPTRFARRRRARTRFWNRDLGPTLPLSAFTRAALPWLMALAPLVIWPGGGRHPFQVTWLVATLACLAEPHLVWLWHLLRDAELPVRPQARYRAGRSPFAPRLELFGRDFVLTSRSGHRMLIPGPGDGDLGVVRIVRLLSGGSVWGYALADDRWRWRAVLPAADWTPRGPAALEAFARQVGLELADHDVAPLPRLGQEATGAGIGGTWRSFGPPVRGLVVHGLLLIPAGLLAWTIGPARSIWLAAVCALGTFGAAAGWAVLARLRFGRAVSR